MANPVRGVIKRVKTVAREVRDIPTALGTGIGASMDYQQRGPANASAAKVNANASSKNWDKQLAEAAAAILKGTSGTRSDKFDSKGKYKRG
jgi:hypothetical protein